MPSPQESEPDWGPGSAPLGQSTDWRSLKRGPQQHRPSWPTAVGDPWVHRGLSNTQTSWARSCGGPLGAPRPQQHRPSWSRSCRGPLGAPWRPGRAWRPACPLLGSVSWCPPAGFPTQSEPGFPRKHLDSGGGVQVLRGFLGRRGRNGTGQRQRLAEQVREASWLVLTPFVRSFVHRTPSRRRVWQAPGWTEARDPHAGPSRTRTPRLWAGRPQRPLSAWLPSRPLTPPGASAP